MEIIILAVVVFWVIRVACKGLFSVGTGKAYKRGKDQKPLGISHYLVSIIQGRNPAKDDTEPVLAWFFGKLLKGLCFIFWLPNKIWSHWIERKWIVSLCTITLWLLIALVVL